MTGRFAYPADIVVDEAGFTLVTFPDIPEAGTDDPDHEAALAGAVDCLAAALEGYMIEGRALPRPSKPDASHRIIALPPLMAAKAALYEVMQVQGVNGSELASRLGISESAVRRMLDLRHRSHIGRIEEALAALGKRLDVDVRDAA